jgi:CDGSH-type Zn-finger protein
VPREIRHDARGPEVFEADDLGEDGQLYICRCGLSDRGALCDGSHQATKSEETETVYKYESDDADAERRIVEAFEFANE